MSDAERACLLDPENEERPLPSGSAAPGKPDYTKLALGIGLALGLIYLIIVFKQTTAHNNNPHTIANNSLRMIEKNVTIVSDCNSTTIIYTRILFDERNFPVNPLILPYWLSPPIDLTDSEKSRLKIISSESGITGQHSLQYISHILFPHRYNSIDFRPDSNSGVVQINPHIAYIRNVALRIGDESLFVSWDIKNKKLDPIEIAGLKFTSLYNHYFQTPIKQFNSLDYELLNINDPENIIECNSYRSYGYYARSDLGGIYDNHWHTLVTYLMPLYFSTLDEANYNQVLNDLTGNCICHEPFLLTTTPTVQPWHKGPMATRLPDPSWIRQNGVTRLTVQAYFNWKESNLYFFKSNPKDRIFPANTSVCIDKLYIRTNAGWDGYSGWCEDSVDGLTCAQKIQQKLKEENKIFYLLPGTVDEIKVYAIVLLRPGVRQFLQTLFSKYQVIFWSAGDEEHVKAVINYVFPKEAKQILFYLDSRFCDRKVKRLQDGSCCLEQYWKPLKTIQGVFQEQYKCTISRDRLVLLDDRKENGIDDGDKFLHATVFTGINMIYQAFLDSFKHNNNNRSSSSQLSKLINEMEDGETDVDMQTTALVYQNFTNNYEFQDQAFLEHALQQIEQHFQKSSTHRSSEQTPSKTSPAASSDGNAEENIFCRKKAGKFDSALDMDDQLIPTKYQKCSDNSEFVNSNPDDIASVVAEGRNGLTTNTNLSLLGGNELNSNSVKEGSTNTPTTLSKNHNSPGVPGQIQSPASSASVSYASLPTLELDHSDRYSITATLQQSLFGAVKLAFDRKLRIQVAIKISRCEKAAIQQSHSGVPVLENVGREAAIMKYLAEGGGTVNDPLDLEGKRYICKFIEECRNERFHYLINEFAPAGDLYSKLTSSPKDPMSESQARRLFRQIVLGMKYLHSRNLVHLDMSLENICLDADENIRIIDFGVAAIHPSTSFQLASAYFEFPSSVQLRTANHNQLKKINTADTKHLADDPKAPSKDFPCQPVLQLRNKPGKIRYMSPELFTGAPWDAFANDIFSIGVILYSLLTCRPAFEQPNNSDIWFDVIYSGQWLTQAVKEQRPARVYTHLSTEALDLINRIIKPERHRLTIQEILAHPWMNIKDDELSTASAKPQ